MSETAIQRRILEIYTAASDKYTAVQWIRDMFLDKDSRLTLQECERMLDRAIADQPSIESIETNGIPD